MAVITDYATAIRFYRADLAASLYNKELWFSQSQDWSKDAVGAKVVWQEDQQEAEVVINNTSVPLTPTAKTEITRDFDLEEFQSIPQKLNFTEELVVNYAKRQNLLESHLKSVRRDIALRALYYWMLGAMANDRVVPTSGSAQVGLAPGASGNRKKITYDDIVDLQTIIAGDDVELEAGKMNLLIPVAWKGAISKLPEFKSGEFYAVDGNTTIKGGLMIIGTIGGCNVWMRPQTLVCDKTDLELFRYKANNTKTPRAGAADDSLTAVMWHSDYVIRAVNLNKLGKDKTSTVSIVPAHGATEFSVTGVGGGNSFYQKGQGVAVLYEAPAS